LTSADAELQVRELVATTFGVPVDSISRSTVRDEVEGWDSLGQLTLVLAVEDAFDMRLSVEQMQELNSVDAIVNLVG
jgi:acyl carrier protein